jgi:hypothetical protein
MKIKLFRKIFIAMILCLSLSTQNLQSEEKPQTNDAPHIAGWFSIGLGKCYFGPTGYYSLSFAYNENICTVRYLTADEFKLNFGGASYDNPMLSIKEKGMLYGRSYRKENLFLSLSGGIGYISGIDRGKKIAEKVYERVNISTYGIPFEAKFRFDIGFVGIGGAWFGNINRQKFLSGGLLEISIGVF